MVKHQEAKFEYLKQVQSLKHAQKLSTHHLRLAFVAGGLAEPR